MNNFQTCTCIQGGSNEDDSFTHFQLEFMENAKIRSRVSDSALFMYRDYNNLMMQGVIQIGYGFQQEFTVPRRRRIILIFRQPEALKRVCHRFNRLMSIGCMTADASKRIVLSCFRSSPLLPHTNDHLKKKRTGWTELDRAFHDFETCTDYLMHDFGRLQQITTLWVTKASMYVTLNEDGYPDYQYAQARLFPQKHALALFQVKVKKLTDNKVQIFQFFGEKCLSSFKMSNSLVKEQDFSASEPEDESDEDNEEEEEEDLREEQKVNRHTIETGQVEEEEEEKEHWADTVRQRATEAASRVSEQVLVQVPQHKTKQIKKNKKPCQQQQPRKGLDETSDSDDTLSG